MRTALPLSAQIRHHKMCYRVNVLLCAVVLAPALGLCPPQPRSARQSVSRSLSEADPDGDESLKAMKDRQRREGIEKAVELGKDAVQAVLQERTVVDRFMQDGLLRREVQLRGRDSTLIDAYEVAGMAGLDPWSRLAKSRRMNAERHVIVMLADVYGWRDSSMRAAADRLSRECGAVVVVPDLFRGGSWPSGQKPSGDAYEAWRDSHPAARVECDIEDSVAAVTQAHKADSVGLVGFCYGGGRVLETLEKAADALPVSMESEDWETLLDEREDGDLWEELAEDRDGGKSDEAAEPEEESSAPAAGWADGAPISASVVFYPTRYDPSALDKLRTPLCAIFGEEDEVPGATTSDVNELRSRLEQNEDVKAFHVHMEKGQTHGFAHKRLRRDGVARFNTAAEGLGVSPGDAAKSTAWAPDRDYPVDVVSKLELESEHEEVAEDEWGEFGARRPMEATEDLRAFGREAIPGENEAAESAFMVATAWLDTYMRVYLPTVGTNARQAESKQA